MVSPVQMSGKEENGLWLGCVGSLVVLRAFLRHRFRVVLDRWKHGLSDVLGRLHHPLEGLAVVDGAIYLTRP